jgi:lactoylglutathione lyase
MRIDHIALWTPDLERLKTFYEMYFQVQASAHYHNPRTGFTSYFLTFDSGARLELMQNPAVPASLDDREKQFMGYIHLAMDVESEAAVDALTARLNQDGYRVVDGPRRTGDGYYESVIFDPDGNRIEITC